MLFLFLFLERIQLQQQTYQYLLANHELKKSLAITLDEDIKELNQKLYELRLKQEMVRSQFDIDNLRNEIRNLTNEKAELELAISKSKSICVVFVFADRSHHHLKSFSLIPLLESEWTCPVCTYKNKNEDVSCNVCFNERDGILAFFLT